MVSGTDGIDRARRRRLLIGAGALAVVAIALVVVLLAAGDSDEERGPATDEVVSQFDGIPQQGAFLGAADAPVVVEEYLDLQCPFCAQFAGEELGGIVTDYVKPGRVRMRQRTLTFLGEDSLEAGRAAVAAGLQNRQWQFTEAFYADQGPENSGYVTATFLRDVAEKAGVDADRMLSDSASAGVARRLSADSAAAQAAQLQSTPTFLVGRRGGRLRPVTADQLRAAIDAALARA